MNKNKNKLKKAVAVKYEGFKKYNAALNKEQAPKIVASGAGKIAEKIIDKANAYNIPLYKDADLAEVLSKLDIGTEIPPELYNAVAEILAYVYLMNQKYSSKEFL